MKRVALLLLVVLSAGCSGLGVDPPADRTGSPTNRAPQHSPADETTVDSTNQTSSCSHNPRSRTEVILSATSGDVSDAVSYENLSERQQADFDSALETDMSTLTFDWVWSEFGDDAIERNGTRYAVRTVATTITDMC